MASVKIVLRKKQNKDGSYPLALRITKNRKSSFVHLGHHIQESFWDAEKSRVRKSHPNSVRLNNLISKKLAEAEDNLIDLEVLKKDTSSVAIKTKLRAPKQSSFFAAGDAHLKGLKKQGKYNSFSADATRINAFKEFLNNEDIPFQEITLQLLNTYRIHLKGEKKLAEQTIVNYLTIIQTLFNRAVKDGIVESNITRSAGDRLS
jgi:integrase/recombinase XerD